MDAGRGLGRGHGALLFVKGRHAEEQFLWAQVEETRKHRAEHPDEVVTATADDWDRLTGGEGDEG